MPSKLSISYITGSAKVTENNLLNDKVIERNRRTVGQMFFQPYESKEEFIYCARHMFTPLAAIGCGLLDPISLINAYVSVGILSAACAAISAINKLCGDEINASFFLDVAEYFIIDLCQSLIDIVILPLSAFVMLTRGISTGLQTAGITKEPEEAPSQNL